MALTLFADRAAVAQLINRLEYEVISLVRFHNLRRACLPLQIGRGEKTGYVGYSDKAITTNNPLNNVSWVFHNN